MEYNLKYNGVSTMSYCESCNYWSFDEQPCTKCGRTKMLKALPLTFDGIQVPCLPLVFKFE